MTMTTRPNRFAPMPVSIDNVQMLRRRTLTSLRLIADALGSFEADPAVSRLAAAFGGDPTHITDRRIGEPGYRSRHLHFSSGGEIITHDEAVVSVTLHVAPTPTAPQGVTLNHWFANVDNDATLDDLAAALKTTPKYTGEGSRQFTLEGLDVWSIFTESRLEERGNLLRLLFRTARQELEHSDTHEQCPTCSNLLVRRGGEGSGVAVDDTVAALSHALEHGLVTEDESSVALSDLLPLHTSGLMDAAETRLTCTACGRVLCLTIFRNADPTFEYVTWGAASTRPLDEIPPVEQWGDAARIAAESGRMHLVDHLPGGWFLVEQSGELFLDARYSCGPTDFSALIRLDDSEREAYRAEGADYISDLARRIDNSGPFQKESPYFSRDLYRTSKRDRYKNEVNRAVSHVTWMAQQRRRRR